MRIQYAALTQPLNSSGNEIQLLPDGEFRAGDGRPGSMPGKATGWKIDAESAARLSAALAARRNPLVIDYEHQTLFAEQNGQPAPAAGWFRAVEYRPGSGLFATGVEWTARARAHIEAGEYKYISPVFSFDRDTGAVREMHMAALTNNPALDGMAAVAALSARLGDERGHAPGRKATTPEEDHPMKALAKLLGLADDATEADITAAVTALNAKVTEQTAALTANAAELAQLKTETAALKTAAPDPAKYVPVAALTALQTDLAALKKQRQDDEVEQVIEAALAANTLAPALVDWAKELGAKDIAALRAYLDKATPIAALTGLQTRGRVPAGSDAGRDPNAIATAALKYQSEQATLGITVSTPAAVDHVLAQQGGAK